MNLPESFIEHVKPLLENEDGQLQDFLNSYDQPEWHGLRFRDDQTEQDICSLPEVRAELGIAEEDKVEWSPRSYYYKEDARPGLSPLHEMGLFYIQEPSAMGPAALLAPNPGERVLDLCAAPGGKTTELASFLQGQGLLVANEIHPARAKILASNVERMGIGNALVLNEDSAKLKDRFPDFFHRVLVDAPCSGEGMFRKNPEAISEWSMDNVKLCAARQLEILDNAAAMLLAGGTMVYSTCTFAKEENEDVMDEFLSRHPEFSLVESRRFWPHKDRGEGHFMALLKKEGSLSDFKFASSGKKLEKKTGKLLEEFLRENFTEDYQEKFWNTANEQGFITFGDRIFLAPPQCPGLDHLKVLRAGLELVELKKDRLEPAHAWALHIGPEVAKRSYALDSVDEAKAYQHGETKSGLSLDKKDFGWTILTYLGYSMGWGKASGNQVKNHYPKGLRR